MGNIIFIPGIMGSELTVTDGGDDDVVWISFWRLIRGGIKKLQLASDGVGEADSKFVVRPSGLDKDSYAETILWLKAYWNVELLCLRLAERFGSSCGGLKDLVQTKFKDQPVHLVAHSMEVSCPGTLSGCIPRYGRPCRSRRKCRAAVSYARHAELWVLCHCAGNGGSGETGEVVGGGGSPTRLGGGARHSEWIRGSYQLLPSPAKLSASEQRIYDPGAWGRYPISASHLNRARKFHVDLDVAATTDPERMAYIAGFNRETLNGVTIDGPGMFEFDITLKGDGRVTHALGLPPGCRRTISMKSMVIFRK